MGYIARSGIARGKRVPLDNLLPQGASSIPPFTRQCFKQFACEPIAERIQRGERLSKEDITWLVREAPISVLMKLVEISGHLIDRVALPRPIVVLPLHAWLRTHSATDVRDMGARFLRAVSFSEIDVVLDWFDFSNLEPVLDVVEQLTRRRPGVRFVGPSIEDIFSWLKPKRVLDGSEERDLDDLLFGMRKAGFYRLRFTADTTMLRRFEIPERLLKVGLITVAASVVESRDFIENLFQLEQLTADGWPIDVWLPCRAHAEGYRSVDAANDILLLRALAVGTLVLSNIPVRRASSSFISLEGMTVSRHLGANDLGYGALDDATINALGVLSYDALLRVLSR